MDSPTQAQHFQKLNVQFYCSYQKKGTSFKKHLVDHINYYAAV